VFMLKGKGNRDCYFRKKIIDKKGHTSWKGSKRTICL